MWGKRFPPSFITHKNVELCIFLKMEVVISVYENLTYLFCPWGLFSKYYAKRVWSASIVTTLPLKWKLYFLPFNQNISSAKHEIFIFLHKGFKKYVCQPLHNQFTYIFSWVIGAEIWVIHLFILHYELTEFYWILVELCRG